MGNFYLSSKVVANGDFRMNNDTALKLFNSFTFKKCSLVVNSGAKCTFLVGNVELPRLDSEYEYALTVNENGIGIVGKDYGCLMRGFFAMLMKIEREYGKSDLFIRECNEVSKYKLQNRMIHICVFPESSLIQLKRLVRLIGALQYTHIVVEFWGTLKLDTLPQLSWENAFSKDEIGELLKEIKDLGLKAIPMFNSLGHASLSRSMSGKHTVLDNDSSLYYLFTPDGWAWDLENEQVWALLKKIRLELYELFDDCEYFHLGFDESHIHSTNSYLSSRLPYYLSRLTNEVASEGKHPMVWMDMLLPPCAFKDMKIQPHSKKSDTECREIIKMLAPSTVLIDWEYDVCVPPISSLIYFKDIGYDIMGAPWLDPENGYAHIDTVVSNNLFGVMQTTWHTLSENMDKLLHFAKYFGASLPYWENECPSQATTATLLRCVTFEKLDYLSTGWIGKQIKTDC